MVLIQHTADDVKELIDQYDRISRHLKDVRTGMVTDGPASVTLQVLKAKRYMDWLEGWAKDVETEFEKERARKSAEKSRMDIASRKKGRNGATKKATKK